MPQPRLLSKRAPRGNVPKMRNVDVASLRVKLLLAIGSLSAVGIHGAAKAGPPDEERTVCLPPESGGECPTIDEALTTIAKKDPEECPTIEEQTPSLVDGQCCYKVRYHCSGQVVGCNYSGRPLVIEGRPLLGGTRSTGKHGWVDPNLPPVDPTTLTPRERNILALHYAHVGASEYASIAGFQRFFLDLVANCAPPELIWVQIPVGCKFGFCIYSPVPVPVPVPEVRFMPFDHERLDVYQVSLEFIDRAQHPPHARGNPVHRDLYALSVATIQEGCTVETLSACLLSEAQHRATEKGVRVALSRMCRDEHRHAALAWRTLSWALSEEPRLVGAIQQTFQQAIATLTADGFAHRAALEQVGLLRPENAKHAFEAAIHGVIEPCLDRLLAAASAKNGTAAAPFPPYGRTRN